MFNSKPKATRWRDAQINKSPSEPATKRRLKRECRAKNRVKQVEDRKGSPTLSLCNCACQKLTFRCYLGTTAYVSQLFSEDLSWAAISEFISHCSDQRHKYWQAHIHTNTAEAEFEKTMSNKYYRIQKKLLNNAAELSRLYLSLRLQFIGIEVKGCYLTA